jgi:hypothetical protein
LAARPSRDVAARDPLAAPDELLRVDPALAGVIVDDVRVVLGEDLELVAELFGDLLQ